MTDFLIAGRVFGIAISSSHRLLQRSGRDSQGGSSPSSKIGISDDEWTIAEVLKQKNYSTAIYGRRVAPGHHPQFLPTAWLRRLLWPAVLKRHGFTSRTC